jgi:ribosomal protein S1
VISNVVDFGALAQAADGVEGLIHVSEMHGTRDMAPQDLLYPGDTVLAFNRAWDEYQAVRQD